MILNIMDDYDELYVRFLVFQILNDIEYGVAVRRLVALR